MALELVGFPFLDCPLMFQLCFLADHIERVHFVGIAGNLRVVETVEDSQGPSYLRFVRKARALATLILTNIYIV
jgi:hypothetical protein